MRARLNTPLKQHLAENGISQVWLAGQVDVTRQEMWAWVHGLHVPSEHMRRAIASKLGKTDDAQQIQEIVSGFWPDESTEAAA